jgi:hypothetical protein
LVVVIQYSFHFMDGRKQSILVVYQIFCALFIFSYQIWRISLVGLLQFYFLTNYTWFINGLYFTFVTLEFFGYGFPRVIHVLFSLSQIFSWHISIMFWVLLSGSLGLTTVDTITKVDWVFSHTFSLILPLVDLWYGKRMLNWADVIYPIVFQTAYSVFVLIARISFKLEYPYPFLLILDDPVTGEVNWGIALGLNIGFYFILMIMTALAILFIKLRDRNRPSKVTDVELLLPIMTTES